MQTRIMNNTFKGSSTFFFRLGDIQHLRFISLLLAEGRGCGCGRRAKPKLLLLYTVIYFNAFETNTFLGLEEYARLKLNFSQI